MNEIKIEKDVPIPDDVRPATKYPWRDMEVGDSFLVPLNGNHDHVVRNRLAPSIKRYAPKKFITRKVEGGIRVWRIE